MLDRLAEYSLFIFHEDQTGTTQAKEWARRQQKYYLSAAQTRRKNLGKDYFYRRYLESAWSLRFLARMPKMTFAPAWQKRLPGYHPRIDSPDA
jgi:hypothetical protein